MMDDSQRRAIDDDRPKQLAADFDNNFDLQDINDTRTVSEMEDSAVVPVKGPEWPEDFNILAVALNSPDDATANGQVSLSDSTNPIANQVDTSRDWTQFRGPDGQGHSAATGIPLRWNEKKNVAWKVPIRGHGWSSPVIANDRIWLTTAIAAEKSLRVICLDAKTGKILHDVEVFHERTFGGIHQKNSHATPTPVLFDDRCYVHFGSHGTAALDMQGKILWKTKLDYYHHHGPAGSPAVADGAAIIACDGMTFSFYDDRKIRDLPAPQFVVALELATGDVRWKSQREGTHSYVTPLAIEVDGKTQVVSPGGNQVIAYDPRTGDEIWSCRYQGYSVVPRPVFGHGLVFVCTGYDTPSLLAIQPDGQGDVTETNVVWKTNRAVPLMSSPILVGEELYMISNQGVVTCLEAKTGKVNWRHRLGGNYSSSPVLADGHLYFLDEVGTTHVLEPGLKVKVLAKNQIQGKTQASLAISGQAIFLRSDTHLYRIEEADTKSITDDADQVIDEKKESNTTEANSPQ